MKKPLPANRRIAVACALVAMFAALTPVVLRLVPDGARYDDPAAFVMGLAIGLAFAMALGLIFKQRRGRATGGQS